MNLRRTTATLAGLTLLAAGVLTSPVAAAPAERYQGTCLVRAPDTQPPKPPPANGKTKAGPGYAIRTVQSVAGPYTGADQDALLAACTDAVFQSLMGDYQAAGNTQSAFWTYVVYDAVKKSWVLSGCAASGCDLHPVG